MRRSTENLKDYTERALEASLTDTLIPPLVYIPATLRRRGVRIALEASTVKPPTLEENELRVAAADPTGFLIALMQGQPVAAFEVHKDKQGATHVEVDWRIPDLALRAEVAMELARRAARGKRNNPNDDGYEAMINRAADSSPITKS